MTKYPRYQDYVIKDGKLVGDFEGMYKDFVDPWEQTTREKNAIEKLIGLELLKKYEHKKALEYGCGFGDYTNKINKIIGYSAGIDISETAIEKARKRHASLDFFVGDLLNEQVLDTVKPACICMIEITWYVLEKLDVFKELLMKKQSGSGFFHTLMTYAPGEQKYGADYFTNIDEICDYWSDVIDIKEWGINSNATYGGGSRTFFYGEVK